MYSSTFPVEILVVLDGGRFEFVLETRVLYVRKIVDQFGSTDLPRSSCNVLYYDSDVRLCQQSTS